jgi:hypothetical protein
MEITAAVMPEPFIAGKMNCRRDLAEVGPRRCIQFEDTGVDSSTDRRSVILYLF